LASLLDPEIRFKFFAACFAETLQQIYASGAAHGAYVLADALGGGPEVILIASGSEVSLAVEAHSIFAHSRLRRPELGALPCRRRELVGCLRSISVGWGR
jgi:hypothetical protein